MDMKTRVSTIGIFTTPTQAGRYRLSGALQYLAEQPDLRPVIVNISGRNKTHVRQALNRYALDGLLVWSSAALEALSATPPSVPVVSALGPCDAPNAVIDANFDLDEREIARAAIRLALRRSYANFAYVPSLRPTDRDRALLRGSLFSDLLGQAGYPCTRLDPHLGLVRALATLPKPCLVFAFCDARACAVINACRSAGISVPGQVNVIGVDNEIEICDNTRPTITSVWPDFEGCGYLAARTLHRFLRKGRPKRTLSFTYGIKDVVERGSTIDLRGGGRLVSCAKEELRRAFADPTLSVTDVARRLNVSRQLLDLRFREILGHSVHDELTALRIAAAKNLLNRHDTPIDDVGRACGYNSANAFRYAFRIVTGKTPRDWRDRR